MRFILLSTQSPCTGSQVPWEHWQGEEQFTPKYPSGQVSLQLEKRGKEGNAPERARLQPCPTPRIIPAFSWRYLSPQ